MAAAAAECTREGVAWFAMTLPNFHRSVVVCLTREAWDSQFHRHGRYDLVIMWEQLAALTLGVLDAPAGDRAARLSEGLAYFEARQFK